MTDQPEFPKSAEEVAGALGQVMEHQGESRLAELVQHADPIVTVDQHDNWDGGIWYCTLHLAVDASVFAGFDDELEKTEKILAEKLKKLFRNTAPYFLTGVTISVRASAVSMQRTRPTTEEAARIWEPDTLHLFLSHVSAHKEHVGEMKAALRRYGISAFVAHEDIEPNLEWQNEIELALGSMHALCALLTPEFHGSNWTDQEVGFALGRSVPVISVRLGMDPYGFIGKNQGLRGKLDSPAPLALSISEILLREARTKIVMRDALVGGLVQAKSFATAKQVATMLTTVTGFSAGQLERLTTACQENPQVRGSWGVFEMINSLSPS